MAGASCCSRSLALSRLLFAFDLSISPCPALSSLYAFAGLPSDSATIRDLDLRSSRRMAGLAPPFVRFFEEPEMLRSSHFHSLSLLLS